VVVNHIQFHDCEYEEIVVVVIHYSYRSCIVVVLTDIGTVVRLKNTIWGRLGIA